MAAGKCSITATQAGNATYAAAVPVSRSFTVTPGSQAITFTALPNQPSSGASIELTATASSGLTVRYKSNSPAICQVSGRHVTALSDGACSITASHVGDGNYSAALPVTTTFAVTGKSAAPRASLLPRTTGGGSVITTIAGIGSWGYGGDNGPATSATLFLPTAAAVDSSGNVYIVDYYNNRIRKVTASTGVITTIAGNGTAGYSGDNGPATSAELNLPAGIALDSAGNIFVVDTQNVRIRKITAATGIITTVAGNGTLGSGGDNGPATAASMAYPDGVAVDNSGNIYIADTDNGMIRKVTASTGVITTIAGTGYVGSSGDNGPATNATLYYPNAVALDGSGNVYIADSANNKIRRITGSTGIITTAAGSGTAGYTGDNGLATSATLNDPFGVAVDSSSNVYVAEFYNNTIREVSAATGVIATIAGTGTAGYSGDNGPATSAQLKYPFGVSVAGGGNVYIADYYNSRIRAIAAGTPGTQTITFAPLSDVVFGVGAVAFTATASSGLPVGYTSTTQTVCTIVPPNGAAILSPGVCVVTASQPGNANYAAAAPVTQSFNVTVPVTINTSPSGLTVTVDGSNYAAPQAFPWFAGSQHTIAISAAVQPGGTGTQYSFEGWSDIGATAHTITVPVPGLGWSASQAPIWTAYFTTQYYLTTGAGSGGSMTPASGWFGAGASVQVDGIASGGYQFSGFGGDITATSTPAFITMNASHTVSAIFTSLPAPTVLTSSLPGATTFISYSQSLVATGGSGSYIWSLTSGSTSLPSWLTLTSDGVLSGVPPAGAGGTALSFSVQARDRDGRASSPRSLTLTIYYEGLSINGGPNNGQVDAGATVPFTFSYYDQNGANDISYAQFILEDGSGNGYCLGDWGRPNGLNLYDSNTGTTWGFSINQSDAFCTVSLAAINNSSTDPTLVTVVLNLTFSSGHSGTYSVLTQANYASGYQGSWDNVGSVVITSTPTVQLTNLTQSSGAYFSGDSFLLTITGPPSLPITVDQNGQGQKPISNQNGVSTTDSNGNWSYTASFSAGDIGSYVQTWYVGGVPATPTLSFSVQAQPSPTVQLSNILYPGINTFTVGQPYSLLFTGEPGAAVVMIAQQTTFAGLVINSTVTLGQIGAQNTFQFQGNWGVGDQGAWSAVFFAGGVAASPTPVVFTVNAVSCN